MAIVEATAPTSLRLLNGTDGARMIVRGLQ
jgi:hypothetical protein